MADAIKTLSQKIENKEFQDFISVCDCITKILDALEPIHEKGYLYLDLSPDNICFSDTGTVQFKDSSNAYHLGDDLQNFILKYTIGYSANELYRNPYNKPLSLHYTADLYSITAIFFRLLVGRPPKDGDWSKCSQWQLSNTTGYLKGSSELLVEDTNDFLKKGLSLTAARRFKDIGEMRKEVIKLMELIT